jgi:hypothetical protein
MISYSRRSRNRKSRRDGERRFFKTRDREHSRALAGGAENGNAAEAQALRRRFPSDGERFSGGGFVKELAARIAKDVGDLHAVERAHWEPRRRRGVAAAEGAIQETLLERRQEAWYVRPTAPSDTPATRRRP